MNTAEWDESKGHAEKVAAGWRPPFPAHMHNNVRKLVDRCWSGLPELRPTITELLTALEELEKSGAIAEMDAKEASSGGCCSVM